MIWIYWCDSFRRCPRSYNRKCKDREHRRLLKEQWDFFLPLNSPLRKLGNSFNFKAASPNNGFMQGNIYCSYSLTFTSDFLRLAQGSVSYRTCPWKHLKNFRKRFFVVVWPMSHSSSILSSDVPCARIRCTTMSIVRAVAPFLPTASFLSSRKTPFPLALRSLEVVTAFGILKGLWKSSLK